jgi:hypothetical protein
MAVVDLTTPTPPISSDEFDSARQFVDAVLLAHNPALDLSSGSALEGLMVDGEAYMVAIEQARMDQLEAALSLQSIVSGTVTVDDSYVDSLVSNYFITRNQATNGTGPVNIIVNTPIPYQIPSGFSFTAGLVSFATTQGFQVYPPSSSGVAESATTRIMTARSDGTFQFTITVIAAVTGVAGALTAGTALTIQNPLTGMVLANVASDFTGGTSAETNASLLNRAAAGVTAKVLAGPAHIQAMIAEEFPGTTVSVVGVGSPLMTRDRGNLFGLSTGGKIDIYCRSSAVPSTRTVTLPGTVTNGSAKTVVIPIPYATGIGAYRVTGIRPTGVVGIGGMVPSSYTINPYLQTTFVPFIRTWQDCSFSANAVMSIVFTDTLSIGSLTTNQIIQYDVDILWMPNIQNLAIFATSDQVRTGDILVKAATPCTVVVNTTVRVAPLTPPPLVSDLQNAISAAINAVPMGTASLSSFVVHKAISPLLQGGDVIGTTLRGVIYSPAFVDIAIPTSAALVIPTDLTTVQQGVSPANTFFTCPPSQVGVTIVQL